MSIGNGSIVVVNLKNYFNHIKQILEIAFERKPTDIIVSTPRFRFSNHCQHSIKMGN